VKKVTFFDIFFLFIIISALQPMLKQRMLESSRQRLIRQLEKKRGSRVIALIHRQETMNFLGFPVMRYIDITDSEEVIRVIQMTDPKMPIDLILHTPGGIALAALQIAKAIKNHIGKVTVYVPHYAMSGGTLISLAADEIVLAPHAALGPVDPQLGQYPAPSIVNVLKEKPIASINDETVILSDVAFKAINQLRAAIEDLMVDSYEEEERKRIADLLTRGYWTHDFPITAEVAQELGLHVSTDMPPEIYQLMHLYPQPVRRSSSVEYSPGYRGASNGNAKEN